MLQSDELRTALKRLLGIPDSKHALEPEMRGQVQLDGVTVEKWLITSEPGSKLPLLVYHPERVSGKMPAVVLVCGHGGSKSSHYNVYVAQTYARMGIACLIADPLGEEERNPNGAMATRQHDDPMVAYRCELAGRSVMGKFISDAMRVLDFAETLSWTDPDRLGVAGNSLGGAIAGWLYALEPRLTAAIVSGWAFSDFLTQYGKHCTRVPYQKLRAVGNWEDFLRLGAGCKLLVMNGDADTIIDNDQTGKVWRDTVEHVKAVDPLEERMKTWFCRGGGHRPYHVYVEALLFLNQHLGTPAASTEEIAGFPLLNYGEWCDRNGILLEALYGVELHQRGASLPDLGLKAIKPDTFAVLENDEVGTPEFTIDGWLKQLE